MTTCTDRWSASRWGAPSSDGDGAGVGSFTDGSVVFVETGILAEDNANLNYDPATDTLNVENVNVLNTLTVPPASINFGEVITLSEGTSSLLDRDNVNGKNRASVRSQFLPAGSLPVSYFKLGAEVNVPVQSDDSQVITSNPVNFQIPSPATAQINALHLKTNGAMTNVRWRVTDNATGVVLKYFPSKKAWDSGVGGLDFVAGDNVIDLISTDADSPGVSNLGLSPMRFETGQVSDIQLFGDNVDFLGDVSGTPFVTADLQPGVDTDLMEAGDADIFTPVTANEAIFPSTDPAGGFSRNAHPILTFDDGVLVVNESVVFSLALSRGYAGEDVAFDIDWVAATATTGGVTWGVEIERNNAGGTDIDSDSFAAQQTGTSATAGTSGVVTRTSITLTQAQADAWTAGDAFRLRLQRVTGDGGDTMTGDAQVLRVSGRR